MVLGSGPLEVTAAVGLVQAIPRVTLVCPHDRLLPEHLDEGASDLVKRHLDVLGVRVEFGMAAAPMGGGPPATSLRMSDGRQLPCDMLVVGEDSASAEPHPMATHLGLPGLDVISLGRVNAGPDDVVVSLRDSE